MSWAIVLGGDLKLITSKNVRILGRKRLWDRDYELSFCCCYFVSLWTHKQVCFGSWVFWFLYKVENWWRSWHVSLLWSWVFWGVCVFVNPGYAFVCECLGLLIFVHNHLWSVYVFVKLGMLGCLCFRKFGTVVNVRVLVVLDQGTWWANDIPMNHI